MIIYLAGGFTVINNRGREYYLSKKYIPWNRLTSFYFEKQKGIVLDVIKKRKNEK